MVPDRAVAISSPVPPAGIGVWLAALRVQQWAKNLLIFVPLLLGHQWFNAAAVGGTLCAFLLLLAVTSSTYLLNDLVDLDADRRHETKRHRPLASGALPVGQAIVFASAVLPAAIILGFVLDLIFGLILLGYTATTIAYSLILKRIPLLDTLVIAGLITLRLAMGSSFIDQTPPVWLLTFSMFLFFSLAMAKRHTEVVRCRDVGGDSLASRGYQPDDWPLTLAFGISTGIASLVVLVFYLVDEAFLVVGYGRPEFLWLVVACIGIWIGRIWLLTHRGRMDDDPVNFAVGDRASQLLGVAVVVLFLVAL